MPLTTRILLALAAGLALGIAIAASGDASLLALPSFVEPVGTLWMSAILMTVIPLVVSSLIVGIIATTDAQIIGRLSWRALALFLLLLTASGGLTALFAPSVFAWLPIDPGTSAALRETLAGAAIEQVEPPTVGQWVRGLVPRNPIEAAAEGAMLPLIVFTIAFAMAATRIAPELRESLLRFFQAVSESMLVLVRWIIALSPIGVFALALPLAARAGTAAAGALGYYVLVITGICVLFTLALYPLAAVGGRVTLRRFARSVAPAQAVAFGSRSSLASLPAMLESAEARLGLTPAASRFVLPFAVSTFKFASPLYNVIGVVFVARLYGLEMQPGLLLSVVPLSVLMSFSVPGVPGGAFSSVPVFLAAGVPVEAVGILMAVDTLPDSFRTTLNVTADMTVATILGRHSGTPVSASAVQAAPEAAAGPLHTRVPV